MQQDSPIKPHPDSWKVSKTHNTESELWNNMRLGDESSFMVIYQKFFTVLYNYGSKICSDKEIVKDCIQEVFIEIWKQRANISETDSVKYYLFAALKRRIIKELQKNIVFETGAAYQLLHISELNSEEIIISEEVTDEQKKRISAAMKKLSKRQQEVIRLKYFQNLKSDEIAQKLSMKVESAYNLVSKALTLLKKHISQVSILAFLLRFL
ncbi:RNA polymerase sigma factor (sigma-70 family) [Catalinimonas alkaloidigena]|uniref:RNA polymerase sigma factor n=1 Tax=Catalinimonas alkaloidigena TaxID=1075417 RepID=UPI0024075A2A|nr:sigma-70 family RNA polymerase sigma factor [Catalinimonas alkaloidigena]MDF9798878.1 RNA polymerase sigma factor (sigma-70 family) [Catalinimonas alkaloidigena]